MNLSTGYSSMKSGQAMRSRVGGVIIRGLNVFLKSSFGGFITGLFKGLFALLLVFWLIWSGRMDLHSLRTLLRWDTIGFGLLLIGINLFVCSERWRLLLESQGLTTKKMTAFQYTLVGQFFNFSLPGGVGGDVIKGYYIVQKNPSAKTKAAVTVAMDRLIGLYSMIFMAIVAMLFHLDSVSSYVQLRFIFWGLSAIFFCFSALWIVLLSKNLSSHSLVLKIISFLPKSDIFSNLYESFSNYATSKKVFIQGFFISLGAQMVSIAFIIFVGWSLGFSHVSVRDYFFAVPVGFMVMAIPISPAGVGVGQAAFFYLFELVNSGSGAVGSLGITAMQILTFLYSLAGAWFYITHKENQGPDE